MIVLHFLQIGLAKSYMFLLRFLFFGFLFGIMNGWFVHLRELFTDRAEGAQQLPHNPGNDVGGPGAEGRVFRLRSASGEDQVRHESRHTGGEREGRGGNKESLLQK